jgi:hypothetical protein
MVYGLPATWAPGIEATILYTVMQVAKKVGVKKPKAPLIK